MELTISFAVTKPFLHCFLLPSRKCRALHPLGTSACLSSPTLGYLMQKRNKKSTTTHLGSYSLQSRTTCPSAFPISINASPFFIRNSCGRFPSTSRLLIVAKEQSSQSALAVSSHPCRLAEYTQKHKLT